MNADAYQDKAKFFDQIEDIPEDQYVLVSKRDWMLINAALGATGEAGEFADLVKKHLFHGHPLDRDAMTKEIGDVAWYLAQGMRAIHRKFSLALRGNIAKLKKRYPNGFSTERSMNRAKGDA